jgi:hypothetical protein
MALAPVKQLDEARAWIADCEWADLSPEDIDDLSDDAIVDGVERHYEGGWAQFRIDNGRVEDLRREIADAYQHGRIPERQMCELDWLIGED